MTWFKRQIYLLKKDSSCTDNYVYQKMHKTLWQLSMISKRSLQNRDPVHAFKLTSHAGSIDKNLDDGNHFLWNSTLDVKHSAIRWIRRWPSVSWQLYVSLRVPVSTQCLKSLTIMDRIDAFIQQYGFRYFYLLQILMCYNWKWTCYLFSFV